MAVTDNRVAATPQDAPETGPRQPDVRLTRFFDDGSVRLLTEEGPSAGAVAASGRISGMSAVAFANDARVQGGATGTRGCDAVEAAYEHAVRVPVVGLWHSSGAQLTAGVESLHAVGRVFAAMTRASGVVPRISVVLGPAADGIGRGTSHEGELNSREQAFR